GSWCFLLERVPRAYRLGGSPFCDGVCLNGGVPLKATCQVVHAHGSERELDGRRRRARHMNRDHGCRAEWGTRPPSPVHLGASHVLTRSLSAPCKAVRAS